jgi:hypothetical protein
MWERGRESVGTQRFSALPLLFQPIIASENVGMKNVTLFIDKFAKL